MTDYKKNAPTKVCTYCGRTWRRSNRLTIAEFEARDNCGNAACRRKSDRAAGRHDPPALPRKIEGGDSGWTMRPSGVMRPPGWPDEPVILVDHSDLACLEPCFEGLPPGFVSGTGVRPEQFTPTD